MLHLSTNFGAFGAKTDLCSPMNFSGEFFLFSSMESMDTHFPAGFYLKPRFSTQCASGLTTFQLVTTGDIRRLISQAPCKHCDFDPAPTWLVKRAIAVLAPVIAAVCNVSLQSGFFPQSQKLARVTAHLKKASMDPDNLNSSSHFKSYIPVQDRGTCGYQTVYEG